MAAIKVPSRSDAFELAMKMEQTGGDFYRALAADVTNEAVRQFCKKAAEEEARHLKQFSQMREATSVSSKTAEELAKLAKRVIAPEASVVREVAKGGDVKAAIALAMQMEEQAIFFYRQLRTLFPTQAEALGTIIAEEEQHLKAFREMNASTQSA